jgi:hypothetical protein
MPAEVLVMCAQCGRPQRAATERCIACGAALPEVPARNVAKDPRAKLLDAFEPFLEGDLGGGRKVLLSEKRLEWTGKQSGNVELAALGAVRLSARPVFEALIFCGLAVAVAPFVPLWPRVALGVLFALGLCACFLQKRYALVLTRKDGQRGELFWGMGRPGGAFAHRARSVWWSLSAELRERQVEAPE